MKRIIAPELCTGCTACVHICPVKCIKMVENDEGFFYPQKTEECINCNKCERICPRLQPGTEQRHIEQTAYAAKSKNYDIWRRSSSGGAFSEICYAFGDNETLFCGAAWDGVAVKHKCVIGLENIAPFCKSKYIASDLANCFSEIQIYLDAGKKVLFSGTPCQVAGLKSFLGKAYDNLLLIDIICHGVGSPNVFKAFIEQMEKRFGKKIAAYEFRYKENVYRQDHIAKISFQDGKRCLLENDEYMQLFIKQDCLRESCGKNCIYRNPNRQGDITIGDFKHLYEVFPKLKGEKNNYSTVVFNTEKGKKIEPQLQKRMVMHLCKISDIERFNPIFCRQTYFSLNKESFMRDFYENSENAFIKWTKKSQVYKRSLKGKIYDLLPVWIRAKLG